MENNKKEIKFISIVAYLHNVEDQIVPFFESVIPVVEENFSQYEIVCVDDACTDSTLEKLKEYLKGSNGSSMVNIVHMSFFHGLESAMNAGRDMAIGDFIYEFDSIAVDYDPTLLLTAYGQLLQGNDIVAAGSGERLQWTSRLFYRVYNETRRGMGQIGPETFRIVSRRAINRIKTMGQYIPYRKAVYANCGLKTKSLSYKPVGEARGKRQRTGERMSLALDSFIYFTNVMERLSALISGAFLLFTVGMGIYILRDLLGSRAIVEGWISTVGFLALGFFGVFALLTIILKYLSVLLNLVFRQQRYLISDVEKVGKE